MKNFINHLFRGVITVIFWNIYINLFLILLPNIKRFINNFIDVKVSPLWFTCATRALMYTVVIYCLIVVGFIITTIIWNFNYSKTKQ